MKRLISIFLLVVNIFLSVSCGIIKDFKEDIPDENINSDLNDNSNDNQNDNLGDNSSDNVDEKPFKMERSKTLFSYKELVRGLEIFNANLEGEDRENPFTVKDDLGENYKISYHFHQSNVKNYYPVSFDDFFRDMAKDIDLFTPMYFTTSIFFLDKTLDECKHNDIQGYYFDHGAKISTTDDDYVEYEYLKNYPVITISSASYFEIEDKSLITVELKPHDTLYGGFDYEIRYDGTAFLIIESCFEIDDDILNLIIDNLVPAIPVEFENN